LSVPARVRAAVVGIAGPELGAEEEALLRRLPPAGVILFARNCVDRVQLRRLTTPCAPPRPAGGGACRSWSTRRAAGWRG
jgi:beta-glucosidase-like glycosyl hydrolase